MKRTKETFFRDHPHHTEREGVSGCKEFDGEDLGNAILYMNFCAKQSFRV